MDLLLLPFVLAALLCAHHKKIAAASLALAGAAAVKIWPVLLFPLLIRPLLRRPTKLVAVSALFAATTLLALLPQLLHDHGFLKRGWKSVEFQSAVGPILKAGGLGYKDMGHYTFTDGDGNATRADYTFAYHKVNGRVLISLHHSSLTWFPPIED